MKSNIKRKTENKVILSIGMIVKNEEKHLDKCLSALQKLRDKVPNELIIVDTGSTDRTKEIALKYTDKVYDFEWINDFSAARNHGLEKAVGEWFMFIDADEYLDENCEEMVNFFNMPEVNRQYNSASFMISNYSDSTKRVSNQFYAPRVVRNFDGLKFSDPIHEWLPQPLPHGFFSTVFHHYGYVFKTKAEKDLKSKRNMEPLLEEYEKSPKNMRVLYHLCDAIYDKNYFDTHEKQEKYLDEFLEEAKKNIDQPYAMGAYIRYSNYYIVYERYSEAIDILKEFVEIDKAKTSIIIVEAFYYLTISYINLEKYEEAFEAIEKYFEYYQHHQDNKLDMTEMRFGTIQGITKYNYEDMLLYAARCLNNLERYDEALEYLSKLDFSEVDFPHLKVFLNIVRDLVNKTQKFEYAVKCYENISELGDNDKTGLALFLLEQYYMENPKERETFVNTVVEHGVRGKFVELMQIVKSDMDGKDVSMELSGFLSTVDRWNDGYSEAVYLAMKNNVDITEAIQKMGHNVLKEVITTISKGHKDEYAITALEYCRTFDFGANIKNMFWCVCALEAAVHNSNEMYTDDKGELYDMFISVLSDYVYNIYNPDLLNPEEVDILPELHRFGYYITAAFMARNDGDLVGYVRNMKDALRLCEPMKDVVSFYLNELEEEMKTY